MTLLRPASHAVFVLGLAASFAWAWWALSLFEQSAPGCGLPALGIYGVAIVGCGIASLLALLLNTHSFLRLPKPRPVRRVLELAVLATPAALTVLLIGVSFYAG